MSLQSSPIINSFMSCNPAATRFSVKATNYEKTNENLVVRSCAVELNLKTDCS